MSDILKEGLQALCERLSAKAFPLTPHDTAEPCITLCDLQEECRALAARAAAPLPTARDILSELSAFLLNMRRDARDSKDVVLENYVEGIEQFVTRLMASPQPISGLQRTAGDVLRQFRESGSEDWGELESAINWWAMNDFCPNFTKGDRAEVRVTEALASLPREWRHQASEFDDQSALLCAKQLERALESA